jgi:hypothetical protein
LQDVHGHPPSVSSPFSFHQQDRLSPARALGLQGGSVLGLARSVESINDIISTYVDKALGDAQLYPDHDAITLVPVSTAGASLSASLPSSTPRSLVLTARRCSIVCGATTTLTPSPRSELIARMLTASPWGVLSTSSS